jgi:VWFA-related protein
MGFGRIRLLTGMGIPRRHFLLAAASLAVGRAFCADDKDTTFSADVNVVNVFATVRDKKGQIVSNLNREDFNLQEDGRPQAIKYFARESDLPLTLGLLVDTSMSQRRVLGAEKTASYAFLEQVLREDKDHAFVIHFDHEVELLQDMTSSRAKLEKALDSLETPEMQQGGWSRGGGGGGSQGRRGAGTALYDAVLLASDELMRKQQGRKALILLTDGVDRGSKTSMSDSIASAQRADTLVYSVLFSDREGYGNPGGFGGRRGGWGGGGGGGGRRGGYGQQVDGKKVLQRIFEVSNKETIDKIYTRIQEELRNQYSLGYVSDQTTLGPGLRKIQLTATKKDLIVQARDGYYANK